MKKILISIIIIFSFALIVVFAQVEDGGAAPAATAGMATEMITNYLIDDFEFANTWTVSMSRDNGIATLTRKDGAAADVKASSPDASKYILGVKIEYLKTGYTGFSVLPPKKIRIPGTVKDINVWVAGRNYEHSMSFYISDSFGSIHQIGMSSLNFVGWKKISAYVSPAITQEDVHTQDSGIDFVGIRVDCDPKDTRGKYFVYFDDLSATTDMYLSTYSDPDDPKDVW